MIAPNLVGGYKGNPHLSRANTPRAFALDEIEEFKKCHDDLMYFSRNYIKIIDVDKGLVTFPVRDYQEKMMKTFDENRFVICKLPRQTGKTTAVVAYLLHYILFNKRVSVAILSNKAPSARDVLARLKLAYEQLPEFLKQGIVTWNKGDIELANGSKVLASSTSASSVRGSTYNIVFLDEFAHVPNNLAEEFFSSTYPTISSGQTTKIIIVSTPKGLNMFYTIWTKAIEKKNLYKPIEIHWSEVPGRDQKWKEETIANTSERQFAEEFETEFIGSTSTLISGAKLRTLVFFNPIYTEENLDVYDLPEPSRRYCITVDVSQGLGQDYSAFSVFDITEMPYKQVAKYRDNEVDPLIYPAIIFNVATKYHDAHILIEVNDIGQQVANIMHEEFAYENLIKIEMKSKAGQQMTPGFKKKIQLGVKTTVPVKRIGCANLKAMIENDKLIVHDEETILELTTFSVHNQTYKAEEGNNDDLAMTLVLFSWLTSQKVFKETVDIDIRRVLQEEHMKIYDYDILPMPRRSDPNLGNGIFRDRDGDIWTTNIMDTYMPSRLDFGYL